MTDSLSNSRFNMWRAVIAMVHADGVVTPHELDFINRHISQSPLSDEQRSMLNADIGTAQDVYVMFSRIDDTEDKEDFFVLARALSWCDGDLDKQEANILAQLQAMDITESDKRLLKDSGRITDDVELCGNQWTFKSERSKSLLGFLSNWKSG